MKFQNLSLLLLISMASCGPRGTAFEVPAPNTAITPDAVGPLAYEFQNTACTTGAQTFSTVDAMCTGLQNESLNNRCSELERLRLFRQRCPRVKWKPFFSCSVAVYSAQGAMLQGEAPLAVMNKFCLNTLRIDSVGGVDNIDGIKLEWQLDQKIISRSYVDPNVTSYTGTGQFTATDASGSTYSWSQSVGVTKKVLSPDGHELVVACEPTSACNP